MIAVDTSALVAIALREQGRERLIEALVGERVTIGAPILLETFCVLKDRMAPEGDARQFCAWAADLPNAKVRAFEAAHLGWAQLAFERYGKGRGSGPGLNILDCISYAFAKAEDARLLFTGKDFARSDVNVHPSSRIE